MGRGRLVEHRVLNRDQQLIVSAPEAPGQRMIAGLHNHSFPHHIPELLLCYPVFLAVVAYDQGSFFDFHIRPTVSEFLRAACVQSVPGLEAILLCVALMDPLPNRPHHAAAKHLVVQVCGYSSAQTLWNTQGVLRYVSRLFCPVSALYPPSYPYRLNTYLCGFHALARVRGTEPLAAPLLAVAARSFAGWARPGNV